jgi:hypothetical protein
MLSHACIAGNTDNSEPVPVLVLSKSDMENLELNVGQLLMSMRLKLPFPKIGTRYEDVISTIKQANSDNEVVEKSKNLIVVNCYENDDVITEKKLLVSVKYFFDDVGYTRGPIFDDQNKVEIKVQGKRINKN